MKALHVLEPGPWTTIQDLGRRGLRDLGVPLSGAMDPTALQIANGLVGNARHAAALEITGGGFRAETTSELLFAVTGADSEVTVNGTVVPAWTTCRAAGGDILAIGIARSGLRAYLAVSGGIEVPLVLGSRSTYVRGGFGGFHGRSLRRGDVLQVGPANLSAIPFRRAPLDLIPSYGEHPNLRVVMGPQEDRITPEGIALFLDPDWETTLQALQARYIDHLVRRVRVVAERTPLESFCIGCAWSCNSLLGPALWRKWDKPVIRAAAEEAHRVGRFLHIHFHGKCLETVPDFVEIGADCVCPFERPPGGDIAGLEGLRAVARLLAGRTTMNGNVHTVETLIRGGPADVRREVNEICDAFEGNPRVIVGTGDQVGRETPEENIRAMIEAVRERFPDPNP